MRALKRRNSTTSLRQKRKQAIPMPGSVRRQVISQIAMAFPLVLSNRDGSSSAAAFSHLHHQGNNSVELSSPGR